MHQKFAYETIFSHTFCDGSIYDQILILTHRQVVLMGLKMYPEVVLLFSHCFPPYIHYRLPIPKQADAFMVAYKVFQEEDNYPMEIRRQAIERVCIPLMRLSSTHALVEFFKANIKKIVGIIEAKAIKVRNSNSLLDMLGIWSINVFNPFFFIMYYYSEQPCIVASAMTRGAV